jgi:hypothetical protein
MESVVINILVSLSGVFFAAFGTAWKIQRHFDERVDLLQMGLLSASADNRVERTRMDGDLALLRAAIEGCIERSDHKTALISRDLRDLQGWLSKHHQYSIRSQVYERKD